MNDSINYNLIENILIIFDKIKEDIKIKIPSINDEGINNIIIEVLQRNIRSFFDLICKNIAIDLCICESILKENKIFVDEDEYEDSIINFHSEIKDKNIYKNLDGMIIDNYNYSNNFMKQFLKNKFNLNLDYNLIKKNFNINDMCVSTKKSDIILSLLSSKRKVLQTNKKKIIVDESNSNQETSFSDTQNVTQGAVYYVNTDARGNVIQDNAMTRYLNMQAKFNLPKTNDNKELESLMLSLKLEDNTVKNKIINIIKLLKMSTNKNKLLSKQARIFYMYLIKLYYPELTYSDIYQKYSELNQHNEKFDAFIFDNKFVNTELKPIFNNLFNSTNFEDKNLLQKRHYQNCVIDINYLNLLNLLISRNVSLNLINEIFDYLQIRLAKTDDESFFNEEKLFEDIQIYDNIYDLYKIEGKYNTESLNSIITFIQNKTKIPKKQIEKTISS